MEPMSQRMPHFLENRGTYPIFGIFATSETFAITWQFYHFQWAGGTLHANLSRKKMNSYTYQMTYHQNFKTSIIDF